MLKSNLIGVIHTKYPSLNPAEIESISNLFFKKITIALCEGKKIEIRGFGTLTKKINKAKFVRNPKTNEKVNTPEKKTILFKMSKEWSKKINDKK